MKKSMPPKAIIFDLGGVIIDVDFQRVFAAWAQMAGVTAADISQRFETDHPYQQHERGEIGANEFFDVQRQKYDLRLTDEQFMTGWNAIFGLEVAGVRTLIERATRIAPCHVFSNTNAAHQAYWEPRLEKTLSLFSNVFVSNELKERKPDAKAFQDVCDQIGVAPADALFFDDTQENLDGAIALGLTAVMVKAPADIETVLVGLGA